MFVRVILRANSTSFVEELFCRNCWCVFSLFSSCWLCGFPLLLLQLHFLSSMWH